MEFQNSFCPDFFGCVAKDIRTAKIVERLCCEELEAIATYLYRELLVQNTDEDLGKLFDALAKEAIYHFRLLSKLLLALGGDLSLRTNKRMNSAELFCEEDGRKIQTLLYDSLKDARKMSRLYRSLIDCSKDGVVRSVFACFAEDEERHGEMITSFLG